VLNRLFIAIGVLVILAIGAAFVVPRFIQWGDYRDRLQTMAAEAFGTEVAIEGDIHLTLLPAPKLEFTRVRVGPASGWQHQLGHCHCRAGAVERVDRQRQCGIRVGAPD